MSPRVAESVSILGCRVDTIGRSAAIERIVELAAGEVPSLVVTIGTEMIVRAQHDEYFRSALNASALALCDTIGVVAAAKLQGVAIRERVTGVELIEPLCAALAERGLPVYLIGGKGDTARRAAAALTARVPGLRIAGARDGYFSSQQDNDVASDVARSGASVLLAGLGSPRQEHFLVTQLARSGAKVGIGVGGSFDVLSGNVERAPERYQKLGLEWLYRLIKEPSRFRRQLALPRFVVLALAERAGFLRRSQP